MIGILETYDGIIGAILGALATLIVTYVLRHVGKIKAYLIRFSIRNDYADTLNQGRKNEKAVGDFLYHTLEYEFELFNSSDTPKVCKNFRTEFYNKGRKVLIVNPKDEETRRRAAGAIWTDDALFYNIGAHEMIKLKQSCFITYYQEKYDVSNGYDSVKVLWTDEKEKENSLQILNEEIIIPKRKES